MPNDKTPENLTALYHKLIAQVLPYLPNEGRVFTEIEGLSFYRHNSPYYTLPCVQPLGIVIALQGRKEIHLGSEHICYQTGQILFVGANVSGFAYMPDCTPEQPFLGIALELDFAELSQLACQLSIKTESAPNRIFSLFNASEPLLASVLRLVHSLQETGLIQPLAKLIKQEIALRLLHAHPELIALLKDGSLTHKIIQLMEKVRQQPQQKNSLKQLAEQALMSESSFRQHFRAIAGISPIQYQKQLRLQYARTLILQEHLSINEVATRVGYESLSQFSREYKRFFGVTARAEKGE